MSCPSRSSHSRVSPSRYESTPPARQNSTRPSRIERLASSMAIKPAACPRGIVVVRTPGWPISRSSLGASSSSQEAGRPGRTSGRPTTAGIGPRGAPARTSGVSASRRAGNASSASRSMPPRYGESTASVATDMGSPARSTKKGCRRIAPIDARTAAAVAGAVSPTGGRRCRRCTPDISRRGRPFKPAHLVTD